MAFRGWWELDGAELANSSRVVAHLSPGGTPSEFPDPGFALEERPDGTLLYDPVPHRTRPYDSRPGRLPETPSDLLFDPGTSVDPVRDMARCACTYRVPYDDTWPGLPDWIGDDPRYEVTDAPWYTPAAPASGEFVGVWIMSVEGLDGLPVRRRLTDAVCDGAVTGPSHAPARQIKFDAIVVGCTNAGARFGLSWLGRVLRPARDRRRGVNLRYLDAHPSDTAEDADALVRQLRGVVLTDAPTVRSTSGHGKDQHRQASVLRVEFTVTALDPYVWGPETTTEPTFDVEVVPVTWAHEPDCHDPTDCPELPVLLSEECAPVDVRVPPAPVPSCGGCVPLCDLERRTWTLDTATAPGADVAITVEVENTGEDPLSASLYWRPAGSTDPCDEAHPLGVSGLPAGARIVADSTTGRVRAYVGDGEVRQVGIVASATGAPWRPMVVDGDYLWELVADSAPGADMAVRVRVQERGE